MPFIIQHLIPEKQNLTTVTENDSVQHALSLMAERDFSQLPVVDEGQKLVGMITSDSILRAVSNFRAIPQSLKVSHVVKKAKPHQLEDDLSELLRGLRDTSAIPIVDGEDKVVYIVTNYDTAEYFRHRATDLMLAEDVEMTLRDFIRAASNSEADEADNEAMTLLIKGITPSSREQKRKFKGALINYNNLATQTNFAINSTLLDSVFEEHLTESAPLKPFKKLTLSELIQIFKNLWPTYQADFRGMAWETVGPLLDEVRQIRNAIAHFNEVTDQQRQKLEFCYEFLQKHRVTPPEELASSDPSLNYVLASVSAELPNLSPAEEIIDANDSRYAPLAIWLQAQESDRVICTFKEIETLIQDELPPSARRHRNWWANDTVSHVQSAQWLEVGWRVSSINMSTERVVFSIMGDRRKAYIDFFSQLQVKLQATEGLTVVLQGNLQGRSWVGFAISPKGNESVKPPHIGFSFARRSRLRIEIYISEVEQSQTKQLFDRLYKQKAEIEAEFGEALSWEKLDRRHSSRIAYYRPDSSITDDAEKLEEIQQWAVATLPKFYAVLSDRFIAARKEAINQEDQ